MKYKGDDSIQKQEQNSSHNAEYNSFPETLQWWLDLSTRDISAYFLYVKPTFGSFPTLQRGSYVRVFTFLSSNKLNTFE